MRILVRADGDAAIGTGHVMRTLAIAERVRADGGEAILLAATLDPALGRRVKQSGIEVLTHAREPGSAADADEVIAAASAQACDWVVVDSYDAGASFQERLRSAGLRVLLVDDYAASDRISADVLVNQNVFASREMYDGRISGEAQLLLGPSFAMLRSEFVRAATNRRISAPATRILITLGGADPANVSGRVLDAIRSVTADPAGDVSAIVVAGASNPHVEQLVRDQARDPRVEVRTSVDNMVPLMEWADLAISGAGITVYELLSLGVPTCAIPIVPSQRAFADALNRSAACDVFSDDAFESARFAQHLDRLRRDEARLSDMSRSGPQLVDGRGVDRVMNALTAHV